MKKFPITNEEFEELKKLQKMRHWRWPAAFSANDYGAVWPYVTRGYTQPDERDDVRGLCETIDAVANEFLCVRPGGGRFFISSTGAFYSPQGQPDVQFLVFSFKKKSD